MDILSILKGIGILALMGAGIFFYISGQRHGSLAERKKHDDAIIDDLEEQRKEEAKPDLSTVIVRDSMRNGNF